MKIKAKNNQKRVIKISIPMFGLMTYLVAAMSLSQIACVRPVEKVKPIEKVSKKKQKYK